MKWARVISVKLPTDGVTLGVSLKKNAYCRCMHMYREVLPVVGRLGWGNNGKTGSPVAEKEIGLAHVGPWVPQIPKSGRCIHKMTEIRRLTM